MPLSRDGTEVGSGASCTTSAIDLFSVPSLHAKSPLLTKAKIAVHSAARRPRALPRNFALHGKRQARPSVSTQHSPNNALNTAVTSNPKPAPSLVIPVKMGDLKGNSPRLRFVTEECGDAPANQDGREDVDSFVGIAAHSPRTLSESLTAAVGCGWPDDGFGPEGNTTTYRQHMLQLCSPPNNTMTCAVHDRNENEDVREFASNRRLYTLEASQAGDVGNQSTTITTAAARCRPLFLLTDQSHHLRPRLRRRPLGRLWTGTTVPAATSTGGGGGGGGGQEAVTSQERSGVHARPKAVTSQERSGVHARPKVLFLVSGQGRGPDGAFVGCHQQQHRSTNVLSRTAARTATAADEENSSPSNAGTSHCENDRKDHWHTNDRESGASCPPQASANTRPALLTAIVSNCSENAIERTKPADINDARSNSLAPSAPSVPGWVWNRTDGGNTKYMNSNRRVRTLGEPSRECTGSDISEVDGDDCTASYIRSTVESNATEDGGGGEEGKGRGNRTPRHIRVPGAPPTSLLVMKFPPPVLPPPEELS